MTYNLELDVARSFASDVAVHRMIVKLDHGLHRHLVFERREHSWNGHFELITAPGSLTITGDRGAHTFRRLTDMFQFFRSPGYPYGINASYWAEKLPDAGRSVKTYSRHALERCLTQELRELAEEYQHDLLEWRADSRLYSDNGDRPEMPERLREARRLIFDARRDGDLGYREEAEALLSDLHRAGVAKDSWEWDVTDYDFHFLWCLHAIAWGVRQYDRAVKSGLHKVRRGCLPWDTPLPCTPPAVPKPHQPRKATPINFTVQMKTLAATGGVL